MKGLLSICALGALMLVISCGKDDPAPKIENEDASADANAVVGSSYSFSDPEADASSYTWTVSPSSGVTITGANTKDVTVTFTEAGNYTFTSTRAFPAKYVNSETTFTLTVKAYDVLSADISAVLVRNDGTDGPELTLANGELNVVSAGQTVRYINNSTGEPDGSTWTFEGGTPASASDVPVGGVVDVVYAAAGSYDVTVEVERTATDVEGTNTASFTDLVKAVEPLELVNTATGAGASATEIWLGYSLDIDASTLTGATYTVDAVNMGAAHTFTVGSVALHAESDSIVVVTLTEEVLSSDSISVDYSGLIADAVEGALADNFTDQYVANYKELTYGFGGFENTTVDAGVLDAKGYSGLTLYGDSYGQTSIINGGNEWNVRSAWGDPVYTDLGATSDTPYQGDAMMRFKGSAATDVNDMGSGYFGESQRFVVEQGKTYFISVMVKVISDGQWFQAPDRCEAQDNSCLRPSSFDIFFVNYAGWGNIDQWELGDLGSDWVQLTTSFTASETANGGAVTYPFLRVFGNAEVLLDNYYAVEVNTRQ